MPEQTIITHPTPMWICPKCGADILGTSKRICSVCGVTVDCRTWIVPAYVAVVVDGKKGAA